ncbi:hypothetical protein ADUPG1_007430 [Aduncisulcus paluster]|uniref:Phosphoribulokinase/uridine kinase domain-containing protein n=1 Tax=Aduncisulcus paluster TaxID=2918883 RepID=A0ABQ5KRG7_9EUKA|nr:hypothetical protein ADUPG1_000792 [Aduncisulcus paluster]GKT33565.1 hypothetical protein ADUPG1_007430 [Aduncisulcus paluster]
MSTLARARRGDDVWIPHYDFVTRARVDKATKISDASVIILEGILVLSHDALRPLLDIRVYVQTDADIRLARRIKRDIASRGRDLHSVLTQYFSTVKPSHDQFIEPSKMHANLIIPFHTHNTVAVRVVIDYVSHVIEKRKRGEEEEIKETVELGDILLEERLSFGAPSSLTHDIHPDSLENPYDGMLKADISGTEHESIDQQSPISLLPDEF